jgi:hypothetical protein
VAVVKTIFNSNVVVSFNAVVDVRPAVPYLWSIFQSFVLWVAEGVMLDGCSFGFYFLSSVSLFVWGFWFEFYVNGFIFILIFRRMGVD